MNILAFKISVVKFLEYQTHILYSAEQVQFASGLKLNSFIYVLDFKS